jgi:hypothetical protein
VTGISQEDFDNDPDFEDAYYEGRYDVPCEAGCENGKVMVPDPDICPGELLEEWEDWQTEKERKMGY